MSLPRPRDQVFAFFADAANLARITPPELGFEIVTPRPIHLSQGACIEYRLNLFGIPFSWHTEIQRWNPPEAFVDVQRRGPYKHWVHTHRFREEQGATMIEDEVQYALPRTHRWVNSSTPSSVSSCAGYFGIGNVPFVRIFSKARVSPDVQSIEHTSSTSGPYIPRCRLYP
jgi:ligand-binding SRPBCC domain-containing protein